MWHIKYIAAENFMSFDKVEFSFEEKCYVVCGQNLDNDGQKSNGSGKSSFVDIAPIALFGYSLSKDKNVKDCVNWNSGQDFFVVKLYLENPIHKLNCYIERKIYGNTKSAELVLLVNDEAPASVPTKKGVKGAVDTKAGNKYILEEILDIDADDLLSYYFIAEDYYKPFLTSNTESKLEVIGRFSKSDIVDKAINKLDAGLEHIRDSISDYNNEIASIEGYIKALEDSLNESGALEEFEAEKQRDLDSLSKSLSELEIKLLSLDEEIAANSASNKNSFNEVEDVEEGVLEEHEKFLNELKASIRDLESKQSELKFKATTISNHLAGLITCPKCKHKFSLSKDKYTEADLVSVKNSLNSHSIQETEIRKDVVYMETLIAESNERHQKYLEMLRQASAIEKNNALIKQQQERLLAEYDELQSKINKVESREFTDQTGVIKSQIAEKEKDLQSFRLQLEKLNEQLSKDQEWIDNFSDFKFYLGNRPLEMICGLVNEYLKLNGSDLNVFIEGFKRLKTGELRQALTPIVYRNWTNPKPLSQFSKGERSRLNLTVDLAFQQLINSTSKYGGLDYYQSDELLNGLDSLGIENAAKSFNQLNKTILLVTHSGSELVYDNTITIEKKNKVSSIV